MGDCYETIKQKIRDCWERLSPAPRRNKKNRETKNQGR